jgi:hypothetical protein
VFAAARDRPLDTLVAVARCVVCALLLGACGFSHGTAPASDGSVVVSDVASDAAPDAGFDAARDCPVSYGDTLASSASRYRIIETVDTAWPQLALCKEETGYTHAAVVASMQEIVELDALLDGKTTTTRFFLGGVQSPTATTMTGDWITFGGAPLLQSAWYTPENEPDDGGDGLENQTSQLLIIDRTLPYLHDAAGITAYGIVCECDGVPLHPTAASYIDQDPNNPN